MFFGRARIRKEIPSTRVKHFFKKVLAGKQGCVTFSLHFRQKRLMAAFGATDN
jgi:hypothetical protein